MGPPAPLSQVPAAPWGAQPLLAACSAPHPAAGLAQPSHCSHSHRPKCFSLPATSETPPAPTCAWLLESVLETPLVLKGDAHCPHCPRHSQPDGEPALRHKWAPWLFSDYFLSRPRARPEVPVTAYPRLCRSSLILVPSRNTGRGWLSLGFQNLPESTWLSPVNSTNVHLAPVPPPRAFNNWIISSS
jgi:hypothetical protein